MRTASDVDAVRPEGEDRAELEVKLRVRAEVLARLSARDAAAAEEAAAAYCALGNFYADNVQSPKHAIVAFRRASELHPASIEAIRGARKLYTRGRRLQKALRMLEAEQARVGDAVEKAELHQEEAELRRKMGDLSGESQALRQALSLDPEHPMLAEQLARSVLERVLTRKEVGTSERSEAKGLFEALARLVAGEAEAVALPSDEANSAERRVTEQATDEVSVPLVRPARRRSRAQLQPPPPNPEMPARRREARPSEATASASPVQVQEQAPPPPSASIPILPPPTAAAQANPIPPAAAVPRRAAELISSRPPPRGSLPTSEAEQLYGDSSSLPSVRPQGDGLIGWVFEALHTLEFLSDARQGADFVLYLMVETLKVEVGLVHLYDINTRSFVLASASGPKAAALADLRTPQTDPLIAEAFLRREPILLSDATAHPATQGGRWALIDCARSIACAPAEYDGRYLGAIELANPPEGSEFTDDDLNALGYAAGRLASFLSARGIVLSEEDDAAQ